MARFDALEVAIETLRVARPLFEAIGRRDADLKDQALRAAKSVALNVAEGGRRVGRDRTHLFTIASGSAEELAAALRIAEALGYLDGRVRKLKARMPNIQVIHRVHEEEPDLREEERLLREDSR